MTYKEKFMFVVRSSSLLNTCRRSDKISIFQSSNLVYLDSRDPSVSAVPASVSVAAAAAAATQEVVPVRLALRCGHSGGGLCGDDGGGHGGGDSWDVFQ